MRSLRQISILLSICLLCGIYVPSLAEEDIISIPVEGDIEEVAVHPLEEPAEEEITAEISAPLESDEADAQINAPEPDDRDIAAPAGDFEIEDGVLIKYTGLDNNVVIPSGVTAIHSDAFSWDTNLESVSIPDTVTVIGYFSFGGCANLKRVDMTDSVTEIERSAFEMCSSLKNVRLSNGLIKLGSRSFQDCCSLESISIPSSVECIESYAFSSCDNLKNVTIQDGVKTIENSFTGCTSLESITIPASVTRIDRTAFNGSDNVIIRGTSGIFAEQYAQTIGIPFNAPIVTFDVADNELYSSHENKFLLHASRTYKLGALQRPSDLATDLVWSSSNSAIATVDHSGIVTAVSTGTATITVTPVGGNGKAAQINIVVPEPTSVSLRNVSDSESISVGETCWLSAYIYTPYSSYLSNPFQISWSVSDESILSIESSGETTDNTSELYLKALKAGTATVSASTPDGGKASVLFTVNLPELEEITLDRSKATLGVKEKLALAVTLTPSDAETKLTWKSSDKKVATVSGKGVVTAKKQGKATITVTTDNGLSQSVKITVAPAPKAVDLNKTGTVTLKKGKKLRLKATLSDKGAASALTWTSSNSKVASVDGKGRVKALKKGTATITVKTFNGKKAAVKIKVK